VILGAVMGHGTLLVGPSPRTPDSEALVLIPPGVRVPAAPGSPAPVSTIGWRVALWAADERGQSHIDVGRPVWDSPVSLAYVIGLVEYECPQHLSWVADRVERRLRNTCLAQLPDSSGRMFSFADSWRKDAEAILHEVDIALTPDAPGGALTMTSSGTWPNIKLRCPHHPARYEPRLKAGWMRQLYGELTSDTLAPKPGRHAG